MIRRILGVGRVPIGMWGMRIEAQREPVGYGKKRRGIDISQWSSSGRVTTSKLHDLSSTYHTASRAMKTGSSSPTTNTKRKEQDKLVQNICTLALRAYADHFYDPNVCRSNLLKSSILFSTYKTVSVHSFIEALESVP